VLTVLHQYSQGPAAFPAMCARSASAGQGHEREDGASGAIAARLRRRAIRNAHDAAEALIEVPEEIRAIHRQGFIELTRAWEWHRAVELAMIARPWGFALGDIRMEVHLWYGSRDPTTPLYMAQYLKRSIPHARLTVWPHEGHHVGFTHWREVLKTLST